MEGKELPVAGPALVGLAQVLYLLACWSFVGAVVGAVGMIWEIGNSGRVLLTALVVLAASALPLVAIMLSYRPPKGNGDG